MSLTVALGAAATAVMLAATLAGELDQAIRSKNAGKARKLNNTLQAIIRKNNIKQDELDAELSKLNLNYNNLMQQLNGISRASKAKTIQDQALKEYKEKQLSLEEQKRISQQQTDLASNALTSEISKYENRGLHDVIGGLFT